MICTVPDCGRKAIAKGLCQAHYARVTRYGGLNPERKVGDKSGALNPNWKGGQVIKIDGRVLLFRPDHPNASKDGYVLRYRLVMEEKLGRYLTESEIVHHKNEDTSDDRPDNLELMPTPSDHARLHSTTRIRNEEGQFT